MTAVSTHVLDTVRGEPAAGVVVRLERVWAAAGRGAGCGSGVGSGASAGPGPAAAGEPGQSYELGRGTTDADGRISDFGVAVLPAGTYRLVFATGPYLSAEHPGGAAFFPEVVVTFAADGRRPRYHVPLLLSPYSYSTYRGS